MLRKATPSIAIEAVTGKPAEAFLAAKSAVWGIGAATADNENEYWDQIVAKHPAPITTLLIHSRSKTMRRKSSMRQLLQSHHDSKIAVERSNKFSNWSNEPVVSMRKSDCSRLCSSLAAL